MTTFTISDALHVGWKRLTSNFWFLVAVTFAFGVVSVILGKMGSGPDGVDALARLLNIFVSFFWMFTFIRLSFMIARGQTPNWNNVIEFDSKQLGLYLLGSIIFSVGQMVGFALFVIPGIIVCIRLGFFGFILLDENIAPIPALKKSWEMTRGYFWAIFWFVVVMALVNILGGIAMGVGLLITMPLAVLCTGYVYEKLKSALASKIASAPAETVVVPLDSNTTSGTTSN